MCSMHVLARVVGDLHRFFVFLQVKDGLDKIQAHKRRYSDQKKHRRELSAGSMTFTDGESDTEDEASEFCGSGQWAARGVRGMLSCLE